MGRRSPSQVSLRDVSRSYGRSFALHRIDLDLNSGVVTAVVGDNGAGKSTLLDLIATVDSPTDGEITYSDVSWSQFRKTGRHRIGWISHQSPLYGELTARENLAFFARMYGLDDAGDRAGRWLEKTGLDEAADAPVHTFSSGMTQRLALARALIHNPQLLLLDEPATGLDQQGKSFVSELLDELRQRGRIIVVVSHDFALLEGLADRLVVLRRGKVSFDEPLDHPSDLARIYRTNA